MLALRKAGLMSEVKVVFYAKVMRLEQLKKGKCSVNILILVQVKFLIVKGENEVKKL